jgi:glycosyltransferase involved in cell wall biosynthesis
VESSDVACPRLTDLPNPPPDKQGWPWTEESSPCPSQPGDNIQWPRITIITPSFNQARYVEETIRSVLLQRYPNLEYLVLDGGSTDGSVEIIKKYSQWIDYWISEPDGGQSAAINSGLKRGTGVYATWINSDDLLCKDALIRQTAEMVRFATGSGDATDVFSGICHYVDAAGRELSKHQSRIQTLEELVRIDRIWRADGHIVQPEVLFPRQLALKAGGLDPDNHNTMDYELWGKLLIAGARFHYTQVPFAIFREQPEQKTKDVLRQTQSLVNSAMKLVRQSTDFSEPFRETLLAELHQFGIRYEDKHWKASGRIARLGLPRDVVLWLRRLIGGIKRLPASEPRK